MSWWIFFIVTLTASFLLVPLKEWKRHMIGGLIGMLLILPIDGTLVTFGAIQFSFSGFRINGLPLPYWLSYFPGGILFAYFRPSGRVKKFLYAPLFAILYLAVEFITVQVGIFSHLNGWSWLDVAILNTCGFGILLLLVEWYYSAVHNV